MKQSKPKTPKSKAVLVKDGVTWTPATRKQVYGSLAPLPGDGTRSLSEAWASVGARARAARFLADRPLEPEELAGEPLLAELRAELLAPEPPAMRDLVAEGLRLELVCFEQALSRDSDRVIEDLMPLWLTRGLRFALEVLFTGQSRHRFSLHADGTGRKRLVVLGPVDLPPRVYELRGSSTYLIDLLLLRRAALRATPAEYADAQALLLELEVLSSPWAALVFCRDPEPLHERLRAEPQLRRSFYFVPAALFDVEVALQVAEAWPQDAHGMILLKQTYTVVDNLGADAARVFLVLLRRIRQTTPELKALATATVFADRVRAAAEVDSLPPAAAKALHKALEK